MQNSKRLDYIDAARGIALLFVIYGHTFRDSMRASHLWCDLSYIFVYRFHVSLLFLLSGMSYALTAQKNQSLSSGQYLRKKARSVLLPWFAYSVLIYLIFALAQLFRPIRVLLNSTSYALISPAEYALSMLRNENPYSFHLWYLQTLFLFLVVVFLLDRVLSSHHARIVKILLILLLPAFYALFCQNWVWVFKGFFQKFHFFLLGAVLPREILEHRPGKFVAAGTAGGLFMLFELFHPLDEIYEIMPVGLALVYLDNLAIGCFCLGILALCLLLHRHLRWAALLGRNSMLFYLYHQPFFCAFLGMILFDKLGLPAVGVVVLCMAASLLLPWLFHRLAAKLGLQNFFAALGLPA